MSRSSSKVLVKPDVKRFYLRFLIPNMIIIIVVVIIYLIFITEGQIRSEEYYSDYFKNEFEKIDNKLEDIGNDVFVLRKRLISDSRYQDSNDGVIAYYDLSKKIREVSIVNTSVEDVFLYDISNNQFFTSEGSVDAYLYFKSLYINADNNMNTWDDILKYDGSYVLNIIKNKINPYGMVGAMDRRILYIDKNYVGTRQVIIGTLIDIGQIVSEQETDRGLFDIFYIISNEKDMEGLGLDLRLIKEKQYEWNRSGAKNNITIIRKKDDVIFLGNHTRNGWIYVNIVPNSLIKSTSDNYPGREMKTIFVFVVITGLLAMAFYNIFMYMQLKGIYKYIENSFVSGVAFNGLDGRFYKYIRNYAGLSGVKNFFVILVDYRSRLVLDNQVDISSRDMEMGRLAAMFELMLQERGIRFRRFYYSKSRRLYTIGNIEDYGFVMNYVYKANSESKIFDSFLYISADYVNDDRNIVEATKEILKLYDVSMISFEGRIIRAGEPGVSPVPKTIPMEFKTRLKNNLFNSKRDEAKKLLMNYFAEMVTQGISWKGARYLVSIFVNIFSEIAEEGHVDVSQEVGLLFGQINEFADEIGIGCMLNYLYQAVDIFIEKAGNHHVDKTILKNQFIQYIESNYRKELYLEMAAEHFHLTTKYFSAKFKDITGDNFYEYLTRFRIEESKVLLRNSSHRVNEICKMTGFSNVNSYIRHFKRYEGITPRAFREMNIFE